MPTKPYTPTPKNPNAYPPKGAVSTHRVKDGDNWGTLQTQYKRADVWDLIVFNFGTSDPNEVNWYLKNKIGCKVTTADKKNYRFSTSTSPGLIHIPPAGWNSPLRGSPTDDLGPDSTSPLTPDDERAKSLVLSALGESGLAFVQFTLLTGYQVAKPELDRVKEAVRSDRIKIRHKPSVSGVAFYFNKSNVMHVPSLDNDTSNKALILHECVHALMDLDWQKLGGLRNQDSEAAGYIAQMMYAIRTDVRYKPHCPDADPIFQAAWKVAHELLNRPGLKVLPRHYTVSPIPYWRLVEAIAADANYEEYADTDPGYDGVA